MTGTLTRERVRVVVIPSDLAERVNAYADRYGIASDQAVVHALETMLDEEPPAPLRPAV